MPSTSLTVDRYVLAASVVLTAVLFTSAAADPVNPIKLTALVLAALVLVGSAAYRVVRHRVVQLPVGPAAWAAAALLIAFVVSAVTAPVATTAVLGAYGRNSGLLAYVSALVLFLAALRVFGRPHARILVGGVVFAGLFTATYGLLQRLGIDAIPWNNPFNPIIAALGNPNFASGYLGIAASVAAGGALWTGWQRVWRVLSGVTAALCLLAAALSASVQGPIAAAAGLFVVALAWVLGQESPRRRIGLTGLGVVAAAGIATLAVGALAKAGPAAAIFSDVGSQARVFYWRAALEMFSDRPLLGVGLDHYGSFWRSSRSPESIAVLSGDNFSDAAHSVPLQVLAQGGVLLGLAYAAFVSVVALALILGLLRLRDADRMLLAAVGAGWTAYQVQSTVSIDQIPLIVLHFTLAGAVVATAGALRWRELRLPGSMRAASVHPGDARTKRRVAAAAPRTRPMTGVDLAVLGLVGTTLAVAAWGAFIPLRANMAVADGDELLSQGQGNAALEAYERATALVPGQPIYWMRKGTLLSQVQQAAPARAAYREATERDPFETNALAAAARLAEEAGDLDDARDKYNRLVELDPLNPSTLVAAATFELRHGGAEAARALLEPAVQLLPSQAPLWAALGDARAVLQAPDEARAAYERALVLDPQQQTATSGLAKLAAE